MQPSGLAPPQADSAAKPGRWRSLSFASEYAEPLVPILAARNASRSQDQSTKTTRPVRRGDQNCVAQAPLSAWVWAPSLPTWPS